MVKIGLLCLITTPRSPSLQADRVRVRIRVRLSNRMRSPPHCTSDQYLSQQIGCWAKAVRRQARFLPLPGTRIRLHSHPSDFSCLTWGHLERCSPSILFPLPLPEQSLTPRMVEQAAGSVAWGRSGKDWAPPCGDSGLRHLGTSGRSGSHSAEGPLGGGTLLLGQVSRGGHSEVTAHSLNPSDDWKPAVLVPALSCSSPSN